MAFVVLLIISAVVLTETVPFFTWSLAIDSLMLLIEPPVGYLTGGVIVGGVALDLILEE